MNYFFAAFEVSFFIFRNNWKPRGFSKLGSYGSSNYKNDNETGPSRSHQELLKPLPVGSYDVTISGRRKTILEFFRQKICIKALFLTSCLVTKIKNILIFE